MNWFQGGGTGPLLEGILGEVIPTAGTTTRERDAGAAGWWGEERARWWCGYFGHELGQL
jgi:hypothetical protein